MEPRTPAALDELVQEGPIGLSQSEGRQAARKLNQSRSELRRESQAALGCWSRRAQDLVIFPGRMLRVHVYLTLEVPDCHPGTYQG